MTQLASELEEAFSIKVGVRTIYTHAILKDIAAHVGKLLALDAMADDAVEDMSEEEIANLLRDLEALDENY